MPVRLLHRPILFVESEEKLVQSHMDHTEVTHDKQGADREEKGVALGRLLFCQVPQVEALPLVRNIEAWLFELHVGFWDFEIVARNQDSR